MITTTMYWRPGTLFVLNQLRLPHTISYIRCTTHRHAAQTIKTMAVRGAPAIGVAAAFGIVLAGREKDFKSRAAMDRFVFNAAKTLAATRPTAVNLFWALERMKGILAKAPGLSIKAAQAALESEAQLMYREDVAANRRIGDNGAKLLSRESIILTHCNAGALATADYGTALGVIRSAHRGKKVKLVYVDETRPYLQGARLTAWEMKQAGIPHVLITDNMAGHFMKTGGISAVVVGADRIAANGDTANKIGTYSLSILARYHRIPFYIAAPVSTIDAATPDGDAIVIEERHSDEVLFVNNKSIAPKGTIARHPGFDVTPAANITAIITDKGVFKPREIKKALAAK